jgi:hypothetical protein
VKTPKKENLYQYHLADSQLQLLQEKVDSDLAEQCRQGGCLRCPGKLHRAAYRRKPRGGPERWNNRASFCCAEDGCRKRHTPPSVRFLGRKIYVGIVVILVSAMRYGLNPEGVRILCETLGIDRRTLQRWRTWWLETFVKSVFWKAARARFIPLICEKTLPLSLCQAFEIDRRDRLLDLLKFLSPITTSSVPLDRVV